MPRDYLSLPNTHVRRRDRSIEDEAWIQDFLNRAAWGVFAMTHDGQPVVNSNIFVYAPEKHAIYWHTAGEGRTRSVLEKNPQVCLSVSTMGRLLPARTALEMSVEYAGVTVFGKATEIEDDDEAVQSLEILLDKYFPHLERGRDYRAITPEERKRTSIYRMDIESWVGKKKEVPDDFPGAFHFPYHP